MAEITQERLQALLDYDSETGNFTWRENYTARARKGKRAGSLGSWGYWTIRLDRKLYGAHSLAWLWMYGAWPERIDHADGDPSNNRLSNLRLASQSQNCANARRKSTNTSGHKGVYWDKQLRKWRVRIMRNYRYVHIGLFDDLNSAAAAYANAAHTTFGHFARVD